MIPDNSAAPSSPSDVEQRAPADRTPGSAGAERHYRPDLENCAEVAAFDGWPHDKADCDEANHDTAPWTTTGGDLARPGDWLVRKPDGWLVVMSDDEFRSWVPEVSDG